MDNRNPYRVLLLAPTAGDALLTQSILSEAGLSCQVCPDLRQMAHELDVGAGALLLTEEVVAAPDHEFLVRALGRQPAWSDVPIVLLCPSGAESGVSAPEVDDSMVRPVVSGAVSAAGSAAAGALAILGFEEAPVNARSSNSKST